LQFRKGTKVVGDEEIGRTLVCEHHTTALTTVDARGLGNIMLDSMDGQPVSLIQYRGGRLAVGVVINCGFLEFVDHEVRCLDVEFGEKQVEALCSSQGDECAGISDDHSVLQLGHLVSQLVAVVE
jgi:hypothetical protein